MTGEALAPQNSSKPIAKLSEIVNRCGMTDKANRSGRPFRPFVKSGKPFKGRGGRIIRKPGSSIGLDGLCFTAGTLFLKR